MLSVGLPATRGVTFAPLSVCNHVSLEDVMVFGWHRWRCTYDEDPQVLLLCVSTIPFLFPSALSWLSLSVTSVSSGLFLTGRIFFFRIQTSTRTFLNVHLWRKKNLSLLYTSLCFLCTLQRIFKEILFIFTILRYDLKFGSTTLYTRGP